MYVTGKSSNGSNDDYTTVKYDSKNGTQQWVARYGGTGNSKDEATAIAADANDNIYVTGYTTNTASNEDYTTISYTSTGQARWLQSYDGPAQMQDYATAMAIDGNNSIYVTGASVADYCTGLDYTTIKYQLSGTLEWVQRYNGANNGDDFATAIVVDNNNNVYVTGESFRASFDIVTVKYWQINQMKILSILKKNENLLKENIDLIARSVVKLTHDISFVNTVATEIRQTNRYAVTFKTLIDKYTQRGINLKQKLADSLASSGATVAEVQKLSSIIEAFPIGDGIIFSPRIVFPTMDARAFDASQSGWDGETPCFVATSLFYMNGSGIPTYKVQNTQTTSTSYKVQNNQAITTSSKVKDNQIITTSMPNIDVFQRPVWHISLQPNFDISPENQSMVEFFNQMQNCRCEEYRTCPECPVQLGCFGTDEKNDCTYSETGCGQCHFVIAKPVLKPCE